MSDLQCPAVLLLLGRDGPGQGWCAAGWLADRRVGCVYCDPQRHAEGAALAADLGVPLREEPLHVDRDNGLPSGLRDLSDLHRGETVVVLPVGLDGHGEHVTIDADGWVRHSLPS